MSATNKTNANSPALATFLATQKKGASFAGLVITKKGSEKGRGADKKLYGNDMVHVCVVTGFSYENLCRRSAEKLAAMDLDAILVQMAAKGKQVGMSDLVAARDELLESLQKSKDGVNESTTDHVYEPLVLDGEVVRGARVYVGPGDSSNPRAPVPGAIYMQCLQIASKVLVPAPNGPLPPAASSDKTIAKEFLRRALPIGRYVSYCLTPDSGFVLRAGQAAATALDADAVPVDETVVSVLDDIA